MSAGLSTLLLFFGVFQPRTSSQSVSRYRENTDGVIRFFIRGMFDHGFLDDNVMAPNNGAVASVVPNKESLTDNRKRGGGGPTRLIIVSSCSS